MTKFRFKLQAVLRQRISLEQQLEREMAQRQRRLAELQQELGDLNVMLSNANQSLRDDHLTGVLDMTYIAAHRRYLAATQRRAVAVAQRVAGAQQQVDEPRPALIDASKKRKAIEKLREKQIARMKAEDDRRQLVETDEIGALMQFH